MVSAKRQHAFIFTGPSGTGKTTLARIVAKEYAAQDMTVANIIELDGASNSGKDDIKAIVQKSAYKAMGASPVKSILVDECQKLSSAAWDALLKAVEEPPSHVYWMFCSTEPTKIPNTIQTRCVRYDLQPIPESTLITILGNAVKQENLKVRRDVLEAIAEAAGGSARRALVYLEKCLYAENISDAQRLMQHAGQSKEAIDLCRFLMKPSGGWGSALKIVQGLEGAEPESIRITVVNYLGAALLKTQETKRASHLLYLLECFGDEYRQSERIAPLLRSIGLALGLDQ